MNPLFSLLIALAAAIPASAGILGPLELGMPKTEVTHLLNTYPGVEAPGTESIFGNTSPSDNFRTATPFCGSICDIDLGYKNDTLYELTLNSQETFDEKSYQSPFRSRYKQLAMEMTSRYGAPANIQRWPLPQMITPGRVLYLHIWKVSPSLAVMTGVSKDETTGKFAVSCKFLDATGTNMNYRPVKKEILEDWAKVPEFYELKQAESLIADGMNALVSKQAKNAVACFEKAASLGSGKAYWGLATLYSGGRGVPTNKDRSKLCQQRAASLGYAPSLVTFDKEFSKAMEKIGMTPTESKSIVDRIRRAAKEGCASEQYNLGIMYKNGFGVTKNIETSKEWLSSAAQLGDKQAVTALKSFKQ